MVALNLTIYLTKRPLSPHDYTMACAKGQWKKNATAATGIVCPAAAAASCVILFDGFDGSRPFLMSLPAVVQAHERVEPHHLADPLAPAHLLAADFPQ